jgi:thiol-disulfide isomerase/thioredoxin
MFAKRAAFAKRAVVLAAAVAAGMALTAALPLRPAGTDAGGTGYTVHAAAPSFTSATQRQALGDIAFTDGSGAPRSLSLYRGKVVLINFWATWCGPCVREMPSLASLQTKLGSQPFEVLALSQDRGGAATVKSFYTQQKISNLKVYLDQGGKAGRDLGLRGLPTSILVDATGKEVMRVEGPLAWDDSAMVAGIQRVIQGH